MTQRSIVARPDAKPRTGAALIRELARRIETETWAQYTVLGNYAGRARDDGTFCVGVKTIMSEAGQSKRTIDRINADFKAAGILSWKRGHGNHGHAGIEGQANQFRFDVAVLRTLPLIVTSAPQETKAAREARKKRAAKRALQTVKLL